MPVARRRRVRRRRAVMAAGGAYAVHQHHERQQQYDDAPPVQEAAEGSRDNVSQLTELKGLLDSGALTQGEFDAEKQRILGT
jgi:Short C-terminal domain